MQAKQTIKTIGEIIVNCQPIAYLIVQQLNRSSPKQPRSNVTLFTVLHMTCFVLEIVL